MCGGHCLLFLLTIQSWRKPAEKLSDTHIDVRVFLWEFRADNERVDLALWSQSKPDGEYEAECEFLFQSHQATTDDIDGTMDSCANYKPPNCTADASVIDLARRWLANCIHEHLECSQGRNPRYRPPRLLDSRQEDPRVVSGSSCPDLSHWAMLSHCWGKEPTFIRLTAANLVAYAVKISTATLPLIFQNAINVCRRLGIPFIWIDSLCILQSGQNSKADWTLHVSEMRNIYRNTHLDIAADWGSSPEDGLFVLRNPAYLTTPVVQCEKGPLVGTWAVGSASIEMRDCWNSVLSKRGWACDKRLPTLLTLNVIFEVLQERVLSPRSIHYCQDQVRWQCCSSLQ